jgi:hypothetical protein
LRGSKGVGVTIESYGKVEILYIDEVHGPRKERKRIIIIIIITRYDYNLTIMESPKLAIDNRFKK